jgi:hypothetical protein
MYEGLTNIGISYVFYVNMRAKRTF